MNLKNVIASGLIALAGAGGIVAAVVLHPAKDCAALMATGGEPPGSPSTSSDDLNAALKDGSLISWHATMNADGTCWVDLRWKDGAAAKDDVVAAQQAATSSKTSDALDANKCRRHVYFGESPCAWDAGPAPDGGP